MGGEKYIRTAYELAYADPVHSKGTQTIRTPLYFYFLQSSAVRNRALDTIVCEKARTAARPRCMSEFLQKCLPPGRGASSLGSGFVFLGPANPHHQDAPKKYFKTRTFFWRFQERDIVTLAHQRVAFPSFLSAWTHGRSAGVTALRSHFAFEVAATASPATLA